MAKLEIAVLDDYQRVALKYGDWGGLPEHCAVSFFDAPLCGEDQVVEALAGFEIICAMRERTPFPRGLLERLPNLKLLITTGMRNASIDVAAAAELGIKVSGTAGTVNGTPELTWALILAARRNLVREAGNMRQGNWQTTVGGDLKGKTLGLLGLGRLGSRVARVAHAFDMQVIAWSQNLTTEKAAEEDARLVDKETLFKEADILSIHLVLSGRTRALVGAAELALMKPDALLVNTSRGPIIDETALVAALEKGEIGGGAIDVYDQEPLPADHPLRRTPNTLLSPHIGYVTDDTYKVFYGETVENIQGYLAGEFPRLIN